VQWLLANWMGGTKAEFIHGHRTMKSLGRVEYKGTSCENPAEVEEYLKLYSAQLGGNGFIKFFWQKHEKRHAKKVLAGYSKNDNPYYRTEYWTERWFTGYATAVIVDDLNNKRQDHHRPTASEMRDMQNIRSVVLDGLNICYWLNPNQKSPDIDILLTLCIALAEGTIPFFCFFDANTPHLLREAGSQKSVAFYHEFLSGALSSHFAEVPGRKRADEFILQKADAENAHIISNDQYRDYAFRYHWISKEKRLIKGAVAENHLLIPDLKLNRRIRRDWNHALGAFRSVLAA